MEQLRILLVDDDADQRLNVRLPLEAAGYAIAEAATFDQGLAAVKQFKPDLVILDLMMPNRDGWEVTQIVRADKTLATTPIIMLTARIEDTDKIVGLELGADDYITKPFSPRELVARVRVVLRRASGDATSEIIRVGEVSIDRTRYEAILPDKTILLTPTEFEILTTLMKQPGRIFSRAQLLTAVHGIAFESYERAIDSHIRNLRRKLETAAGDARYIITVHGVGYKFEG